MFGGRNVLNFSLAAAMVAATFVVDVTTPRGVAMGVLPHFIAIGVTAWSNNKLVPLLITFLATLATLGGFFITEGGYQIPVFFNRISLIVAYWVMAFVVMRQQKAENRLEENNAFLEREVEVRTLNLTALAERLRLATESAGIGVWDWESAADRLVWDERMHRIHGIALQDFGGTMEAWEATWHPDDRERVHEEITEACQSGREFHSRFRIVHPDGTVRTTECQGKLQRATAGGTGRMIGVSRDITEFVQTELELRQAQKMEAIGQLTGGVAHDFNNLLAVIMGNLELLAEKIQSDAPEQNLLDAAMRSTLRGADLTQRLLAFARRQSLQPRETNINALVMNVDEMLRRSIREDIVIETNLDGSSLYAMVDPHQVENALLNLVINARDAMPGGGTITIETGRAKLETTSVEDEVTPGEYVMVSVADTGTGMTPEVLSHAFEPFYTTKGVGEGAGLGLSMVYGLAKQSGGHIDVTSREGQGTRCRLYLPATSAPIQDDNREDDIRDDMPAGGDDSILVVEDDEPLRDYLCKALTQLGYHVFVARDGPDALAKLEALPELDMLLTDIVMPNGIAGTEVARAARQKFPRLRVLYSSGYPRHENGGPYDLDDGAELLNKPFTKATLARTVRRVLDTK